MIIADTSALLAAFTPKDPAHPAVVEAMAGERGPYLVSPFVLAELDYLVLSRGGVARELRLLEAIERTYDLAPFDATDLADAARVVARYADHKIGLTDASLVVLAHRHRTRKILTLDHRHFRLLRGPGGKPFTILPELG